MGDDTKKPAIRFAGFTDDWEQRKYADVLNLVSGQDFAPDKYNDEGIGLPYMTGASCIQEGKTVEMRWTPVPKCIAERGDVLLVCKGSGYGTLARLTQKKAHIARQFMALKCKPELDNTFNFYLADSVVNCIKTGARGLIAGIDRATVLNQDIIIPSFEEQKQIGDFLSNLDDLITVNQRKYEKVMNIKKSMLEKMFPRDGANVPEVRFAGFTDDWEQRKFGEIYEVNNERNDDKYPVTKTLSIATMNFNEQGNGAAEDSIAKYKVLRVGDIAFEGHTNKEFRYGRFVLNNKENGIMSPRFMTLRPIIQQDYTFWEYYIHSERVMRSKLVNATKAGTMMNELVPEDLFRQDILVPSLSEQGQIGAFLKSLDHLITLHQRKLEKLQNIKKSCLEKMFVL